MKTPKSAVKEGKDTLSTPRGGKVTKSNKSLDSLKKNKPGTPVGSNLTPLKAKLAAKASLNSSLVKQSKPAEPKAKLANGKGTPGKAGGSPNVNRGSPKKPIAASPKSTPISVNNPPKGQRKRKSSEGLNSVAVSPGPQTVTPNNKKNKKNKGAKSPEVQLGLKIEKLLENNKKGKKDTDKASVPVSPSAVPSKKRKRNKKKSISKESSTPASSQSPVVTQGDQSQGKKKRSRSRNKNKKNKNPGETVVASGKQQKNEPKKVKVDYDKPIPIGNFPSRNSVFNAVKALLAEEKLYNKAHPSLLDEFKPVLLLVQFIKDPKPNQRTQRVLLPHSFLGDNCDVLFLAKDEKGDPENSVELHKELFKNNGVDCITEVLPWKQLIKEYSQFEEKKKLLNRTDVFLIDSKLSHRWPAMMRKSNMRRKAPTPVRLQPLSQIKRNVETALRKTTVIMNENALHVSFTCGHIQMKEKLITENIITFGSALCDINRFPSGKSNIRSIELKTPKSNTFPIFMSTALPNTVAKPKKQKKSKVEIVEGEVTSAGVVVAVHPSGKIKIKSKDRDDEEEHDSSPKKKNMNKNADSDEDDSDLEDFETDDEEVIDECSLNDFKEANKTSDNESSDAEGEIDKAEQEFLLELRKQQDALVSEAQAANMKAKKNAKATGKKVANKAASLKDDTDDEEDDDIDDDSDEDMSDEDVPNLVPAKKPKFGKAAQNGVANKAKPGVQKNKPVVAPKGKAKQQPKGGNVGSPRKGHASPKRSPKNGKARSQPAFAKGGKKK